MKLKKLFALTLSLGLGVSLISCGKDKENENDTTTTTSEVSSSTFVESSTSTSTSATTSTSTSTSTSASTSTSTSSQTSTTTSGDVNNEWKIITIEELIDYLTTVAKPTYNWAYVHDSNYFGNEIYGELKIEGNKFYQSQAHEKDIDIYNYEYEWLEFDVYEWQYIITKETMENEFSSAVAKDNGHYDITMNDINLDAVIMKNNNNYIKFEFTTSDRANTALYNEYGYALSSATREVIWDTVDLTKIKGHIVVSEE